MAEEQQPKPKPKAETLKAVASNRNNQKASVEQRVLGRLKQGVTQQEIAQSGISLTPSDLVKAGVPIGEAAKRTNQFPQRVGLDMPIKTAAPKAEFDARYQEAMTNSINAMAAQQEKITPGLFKVEAPTGDAPQGSANYNYFKDKIVKEGKQYNGLVITKGLDGKPYIGTKKGFFDSMVKGWENYHEGLAESNVLLTGDDKTNKSYLEYKFSNPEAPKGTVPVYDKLGQTVGGLGQTMMDVTASTLSLSEMLPAGAIMFGAAAPDAIKMKYGESLKEYYNLGRTQGLTPDDAYSKATSAAKQAAGWEVANQAVFAAAGGFKMPKLAPVGTQFSMAQAESLAGVLEKKSLFSPERKKAFAEAAVHHLNNAGALTASAGITQAGSDFAAEAKGIKVPEKFERSLEKAEDMFLMDLGFKAISGITQVPKAFKAQAKSLIASLDKETRKKYAAMKEAMGEFPVGTGKTVEKEVTSWKTAEGKTPDIADEQRKTVMVGLTEKLTALEEKQKNLADVHKATVQPEIDDVKNRIKLAQSAKDPLVAELNDDGTPLIKTQENATTETQKPIEESSTAGGVSEYPRTEGVQAPETVQTDTGNRPVSGTEEKGKLILSHGGDTKIEKFDEAKIKGGTRSELGHGFYFSEDTKSKDYGKETTQIDASSLNLVDENSQISSDFIPKLDKWVASLSDEGAISKKDIASNYVNKIKEELEKNPSTTISGLRKNVNDKFNVDRDKLWSEMMVGIGVDGIKATTQDGSIRQAVLYPHPKLDALIVKEQTTSISDNIRKLKIDPSSITGGGKNPLQSNVLGIPIAIWNTSVEVVAKSVEAGEDIAKVVAKVIKDLKEKGHQFDEKEFTRRFIPEGETLTKNVKARRVAEVDMGGIKTEDYAELQRFANDLYTKGDKRNTGELVKALREYQEQRGDTSNIPDSVFMNIVAEATNPSFKPIIKEPTAKKVSFTFEQESDPMRVSARDAFKGMYFAAKQVGKEVKKRSSMAAIAIKDALKGQGLDLDEIQLSRSIGKFVSDKMDTDTAMQSFMDNLDDIINDARNVIEKQAAKKTIKSIQKNAKSDAFSTVAIKEAVGGIDWISPSKIDPEKLGEYNSLLEDFNKSITGQIPESATARQDLINFTKEQRAWSDAKKVEKFESKYDKLVDKGDINPDEISKDEYVAWNTNPDAQVRPEAEKVLTLIDDKESEVMKELTGTRQEMLGEAVKNGEIDPEYIDDANEIMGFDVNKVSPKNIKLLNNIIEDMMSGERPSRAGEIATDIGVVNAIERLKNEQIRSVAGIKTIGAVGKIRKYVFGWKGSVENYKKLGLTNVFRQIGFNEKSRAVFRAAILGDFPSLINSKVINKSKDIAEQISNIYTSGKYSAKRLVDYNDYRIGIASTLMQFEELYPNLETVKNSLISLSKISKDNSGEYTDYVKNSIKALESFGLIDKVSESDGRITDITFVQGLNPIDLVLSLNDRELAAYEFGKKNFAELAPTLDNTVRDVYGVSLDYTNENYIPLSTFFTGDNKVVDLDTSPFGSIPNHIRTMRSGTTFERQPMLVGSTIRNGKDVGVHYDFRFMKNYMTKYHESLTTAYTARSVKQMSKLLNSKGFSDVMSGAFNVDPKMYVENAGVISEIIEDYVNKKRSPYQLSSAQIAERSEASRFLYSRLLHSWGALFKQSLPSSAYLLTEANPMAFLNSHSQIAKAIGSKENRDALSNFLNHTSQTDRVAGGLEIFAKDMADLDVSDTKRTLRSLNHKINNFTGAAFEFGDKYTTVNSLLVGYMKGLNKFGKLDNYASFDLIEESKKGFDTDALAYAENFMAQVNSESGPASKAKVLRESNSSVTRLLQGFGLQQYVNFNIDMGVAFDKYSASSDRAEAAKRILQYAAINGVYALVGAKIIGYNQDAAKWLLKTSGIELAPDNKEMDEKKKETNALRTYLGTGMSAVLGGTSVVAAQGAELGTLLLMNQIKQKARENKEKMGESVEGTWMAPDFNFVYRNNSLGVSGAFFEDAAKILTNKSFTTDEDDARIKSQRDVQKTVSALSLAGTLLYPSPDMSTITRAANRVLRDKSIDMKENLAALWYAKEYPETESDRQYWESRYANETKNIKNLNIIEQKTIIPLADKLFRQNNIRESGKKFDRPNNKVSDILYNISTKSGETMFKIINNRYENKDINTSDELKFLIQYGGVSPEEYALSYGMDKNGKPIIGFDFKANFEQIKKRYIEAEKWAPTKKIYNRPGQVGSAVELAELYAKYANTQGLYEESKR